MGEIDDQHTTALELFIARVLHHKQRLDDGHTPIDVDIAIVLDLRKFLSGAGVSLPSDAFLRALSDVLSAGDPEYFKLRQMKPQGKRKGRPVLIRLRQMTGLVAFLVDTLICDGVFKKGDAADAVSSQLNTSGLRQPNGKLFTKAAVTRLMGAQCTTLRTTILHATFS